jgi:Ca2+-binding EF-hand superfamily protein
MYCEYFCHGAQSKLKKMGNQSTVLRPEVLSDLENNTAFTADEIREYYRTFLKDCPSGHMTMSLEEFVSAYNKIFPQGKG